MSAWSRCGRKPLPVLSTTQNKAGISLTQAGGRPRLHSEFVGYTVGLCLREMKERCTGGAGSVAKSGSSRGPFPSLHTGFTTACNSSPWGADTLFWSTRASAHTPYSRTNTYTENFYPKSLNSRQGSLPETKLSLNGPGTHSTPRASVSKCWDHRCKPPQQAAVCALLEVALV